MAARPRIASKTVRATIGDKDVLSLFHGALGTGEGRTSLEVAYPKFLRVKRHALRFCALLDLLGAEPALAEAWGKARPPLLAYAAGLRAACAAALGGPGADLSRWLAGDPLTAGPLGAPVSGEAAAAFYAAVPPEAADAFAAAAAAAKDCAPVAEMVAACRRLAPHRAALADPAALSDAFLLREAAVIPCAPLPGLPAADFKRLYAALPPGPPRRYALTALHKLYAISHDVYEAATAPDIDVNEFVEVIRASVADVRKRVPRCDAAFDKIVDSVGLLRENFGGYYQDFAASGNNPAIIMENFVLDVSKNTQASPAVTRQFREIIKHYKAMASSQPHNPQLASIFRHIDNNFSVLDRGGEGAGEGAGEGGAEAAPPEAAAPAEAPPLEGVSSSEAPPEGVSSSSEAAPAEALAGAAEK